MQCHLRSHVKPEAQPRGLVKQSLRPATAAPIPVQRSAERLTAASHVAHARRNAKAAKSSPGPDDDAIKKRDELLDQTIANIQDKYGKGSIMKLGDRPSVAIETFPSGCLPLDAALGGGMPKGRVVEVFGPESSGKTTLALHAIAEMQKSGSIACIVDAEHAFDPKYAAGLGVDIRNLLICQPDSGEQALDTVDELARSGVVGLVVVDSVSALVPRAELEGDVGAPQVGGQARLMSQAMRKLAGTAYKSKCTILFVNQIRYKVGVMYGSPETTSGGNALKYYASVRIDVRRKETLGQGDNASGIKVRAKVVKNKVAPPFREVTFDILFDRGIDTLGGVLDAAERAGVVTRKGAYYSFGSTKLGQGREKSIEILRKDPALLKELDTATRAALAAKPDILLPEKKAAEGEGSGDEEGGEEVGEDVDGLDANGAPLPEDQVPEEEQGPA